MCSSGFGGSPRLAAESPALTSGTIGSRLRAGPAGRAHRFMNADNAAALDLPRAARLLEVAGKRVFLIGTAHVSTRSVEDVRSTIERVRPDSVAVELCKPRYDSLTNPEAWRKLDILSVLREGKAHLLLGSLIMTAFQRRIASQLGVVPGAEMLAAIESARAHGAEVVLADRRIEITLKRTAARLGAWSKTKILSNLLAGLIVPDQISESEIEKLKEEAQLTDALQALAREFPQAKETLIDERDRYLAMKIREAPGETVVAVVGAGHVEGIEREIRAPRPIDDLDTVPGPGLVPRILKWAIPLSIVALLAYGFYTGGVDRWRDSMLTWIGVTGTLSALGAVAALGHPLTIASAFVAAPLTTLHPLLAAGWFAGLVQAWIKSPTVEDLETLGDSITSLRGFWRHPVTRILLVVALTNVGASLGTFIAGAMIAANTL
jgi:pheromone shutdown-related protein TraB